MANNSDFSAYLRDQAYRKNSTLTDEFEWELIVWDDARPDDVFTVVELAVDPLCPMREAMVRLLYWALQARLLEGRVIEKSEPIWGAVEFIESDPENMPMDLRMFAKTARNILENPPRENIGDIFRSIDFSGNESGWNFGGKRSKRRNKDKE